MEEFITRFPHHVNLKIDEGLTPLHLAAVSNHRDIVTFLAEQVNEPTGSSMHAILVLVSDWPLRKLWILNTVSYNNF